MLFNVKRFKGYLQWYFGKLFESWLFGLLTENYEDNRVLSMTLKTLEMHEKKESCTVLVHSAFVVLALVVCMLELVFFVTQSILWLLWSPFHLLGLVLFSMQRQSSAFDET
jgi:hypothetical protein